MEVMGLDEKPEIAKKHSKLKETWNRKKIRN